MKTLQSFVDRLDNLFDQAKTDDFGGAVIGQSDKVFCSKQKYEGRNWRSVNYDLFDLAESHFFKIDYEDEDGYEAVKVYYNGAPVLDWTEDGRTEYPINGTSFPQLEDEIYFMLNRIIYSKEV